MKEIWLVAIEVDQDIPNSLHSFLGFLNDFFEKCWEPQGYYRQPYKALVGQIKWREDMRPIAIRKGKVIEVGEPVPRPSDGDLLDQFHELSARRK